MNATTKVKLREIIPNLTCHLCKGYFIDATTIIECLHSFCKSCIVKHLEKSDYCPVCDVQLHSSKPLSSIRSDQMLQEIVYKLVPGLFQNEMENRRGFYKANSDSKPVSQMDSGHVYNESYISSDDIIHLSLEYHTTNTEFRDSTKRFIKCPAAVSIAILKKLLQGKFDLSNEATIEVMYGERVLPDDFLLMDIAYKYSWTQNGKPLQLRYRVKGDPSIFKTVNLSSFEDKPLSSTLNLSVPLTAQNIGTDPDISKVKETCKKLVSSNSPVSNTNKRRQSRGSKTNSLGDNIDDQAKSKSKKLANGLTASSAENKHKSVTSTGSPSGNSKSTRKPLINSLEPKSEAGKEAEVTEGPLPTPLRGRRKRKSVAEDKANDNNSSKSPNKTKKKTCGDKAIIEIKDKEVQLRISENGIICARNASGEERIIGVGDGKSHPANTSVISDNVNTSTISNCAANGSAISDSSNVTTSNPNFSKDIVRSHSHHLLIPQIAAKHIIGLNPPTSSTVTPYPNSASLLPNITKNQLNNATTKPDKKLKNKTPNIATTEKLTRASYKTNSNKNKNSFNASITQPINSNGSRTNLNPNSKVGATATESSLRADKRKLFRIGVKRMPIPPSANTKISKAKLAGHFNHSSTSITSNKKGNTKNKEALKSFTKRLQEELEVHTKYYAAEIIPTIATNINGPSSSAPLQGQNQYQNQNPNQQQTQCQNQNQTVLNTNAHSYDNTPSNLITNVNSAKIQIQNYLGASLFSNKMTSTSLPTTAPQQTSQQQIQISLGDKRQQPLVVSDGKFTMSTPTKQILSSTSPKNNNKVRILPKIVGKDSPILQQKLLSSSTSSPSSSPKKPPKFFKSRHTSAAIQCGVQSDISQPLPKTPVNMNLSSRREYVGATIEPVESSQPTTTATDVTGMHVPLTSGTGSNNNKVPAKTSTAELSVPVTIPVAMSNSTSMSIPIPMTNSNNNNATMTHQAPTQTQIQIPVASSSVVSGVSQTPVISIPSHSIVTSSSASGVQGHLIGHSQVQGSYRFPLSMGMNMNFPNGIPMNLVPFITSNYQPFFSTAATSTSAVNNTTSNLNNLNSVGVNGNGGLKNISLPPIFGNPYFDFQTAAQIQNFAQNMNAMNNVSVSGVSGMGNLGNQLNVLHTQQQPSSSTSTQVIQDMSFAKLNNELPAVTQVQTSISNQLTQQNVNANTNTAQITIPLPASISSVIPPTSAVVSGDLNPVGNTIILSNAQIPISIKNAVNTPSSSVNHNHTYANTYISGCSSSTNKSSLSKQKPTDSNDSRNILLSDSLLTAQNLLLGIHNLGRGVDANVSISNFNNNHPNTNVSVTNHNSISPNKTPRKSNSPIKIGRITNGSVSAVKKLANKGKTPEKQKIATSTSGTVASITTHGGISTPTKIEGGISEMDITSSCKSMKASITKNRESLGNSFVSNQKLLPISMQIPGTPSVIASGCGPDKIRSNSVNANVQDEHGINSTNKNPNDSITLNINSNFVTIYNNNDTNIADMNKNVMNSVASTTSTNVDSNKSCNETTSSTATSETSSRGSTLTAGSKINDTNASSTMEEYTKISTGSGSSSDFDPNQNQSPNFTTNSTEKTSMNDAMSGSGPGPADSSSSHSQQYSNNSKCVNETAMENNGDDNMNAVSSNVINSTAADSLSDEGEQEKDKGDNGNKNPAHCFDLNTNDNVNNNILPKDSSTNVSVNVGSVSAGASNLNLTISSVTSNVEVNVSQTDHSSTPSA